MKIIKNCLICNKEFETWSCRIKNGWGKYCSYQCKKTAQVGSVAWNKGIKGLQPWMNITGLRRGGKLSEEHKKRIGLANSIALKGKKMSEYTKDKLRKANTGRKHTDEAKAKISISHKGEKSNFWRGGVSKINGKIRFSDDMKKWRLAVLKRDNYVCVLCGISNVKLNADHIKSFAFYPSLRLELSNGRTLCVPCHKQTDNYGYKAFQKCYNEIQEGKRLHLDYL